MGQLNHDPKKTYQSTMSQIRKRDWGLHQRNNYEYENAKNESQISKSPTKAVMDKSPEKVDNGENRVTVNSRLK